MAKPRRDPEDRDEAPEARIGSFKSRALIRLKGLLLLPVRLRGAISHFVARQIDRADSFLRRQRARLEPAQGGDEDEDDSRQAKKSRVQEVPAPEPVPEAVPAAPAKRRPLLGLLLGVMLLLIGIIGGGVFSFNLFAQKIESQGDFIANQADAVFESDKETRKAERALDKARDEIKETRQELESVQAELDKAKARLADIEGRAMIYGGGSGAASPQTPGSLASRPAAAKRGPPIPNRTCNLGSAASQSDMSKCLSQAR